MARLPLVFPWRHRARAPRWAVCARSLLARVTLGSALLFLGCGGKSELESEGGLSESDPSTTDNATGEGGEDIIFLNPDIDLPIYCPLPDGFDDALVDHVYDPEGAPPRVLYSWTSAEQDAEMRAGGALLLVGEHPVLGRGIAMDALFAHVASEAPTPLSTAVSQIFTNYRYSWKNPWATRVGWPGEVYGDRLVRMVLRENAWVGYLSLQGVVHTVKDLEGNVIPGEDALAQAWRIGALFYQHMGTVEHDGPLCSFGSFTSSGGDGGYREFIVGNEEMVAEWSLGTEEILTRLKSDIDALTAFLEASRPCPPVESRLFNATVSCLWGQGQNAYLESLALPSELYVPTAENLERLIVTLRGDLFEPEPYVVTPLAPPEPDAPPPGE